MNKHSKMNLQAVIINQDESGFDDSIDNTDFAWERAQLLVERNRIMFGTRDEQCVVYERAITIILRDLETTISKLDEIALSISRMNKIRSVAQVCFDVNNKNASTHEASKSIDWIGDVLTDISIFLKESSAAYADDLRRYGTESNGLHTKPDDDGRPVSG